MWYLQNGTIKRIYTPTKVFTNSSSDQLMVAIEFAMSKKSGDDTGYRTKEGMKAKALTMGHPPKPPVLGYISEGPVGRKKWVIDPIKGPLVKKVFKQFSTGKFTFEQIAEYAYQIGLKSTSKKTTTGKISKNTWQNRLMDIQYTGVFEIEGEKVAGKYAKLIDPILLYRVQEIIAEHEHPKENHIDYAYSGLIKCGICGGMLSGTNKKGITYYRCGKRKLPCKNIERITYISEETLEETILSALETIEINQETWEAAREYVS